MRTLRIGHCLLVFPHPIDLLIAKLTRLEEKDLEAFRVVRRKTGHPTEAELIEELRMAVDLFRPGFEEEQSLDLADNCRRLWPAIYGREIDPRQESIAPALLRRREGYGAQPRDYKSELRDAAHAGDSGRNREGRAAQSSQPRCPASDRRVYAQVMAWRPHGSCGLAPLPPSPCCAVLREPGIPPMDGLNHGPDC